MESPAHEMAQLFEQLGLPSDEASIVEFISTHGHLHTGLALSEAPFWTLSQAAFLREAIQADADWAEVVDRLNASLHAARDAGNSEAPR
jgi:hypothetical protein